MTVLQNNYFRKIFNTFERYKRTTQKRLGRKIRPIVLKQSINFLNKNQLLGLFNRRPLGAIPPDYGDLAFIYRLIRFRKPKIVLEFGSGCSTIIIAKALLDNFRELNSLKGFLFSMESSEDWKKITLNSMPDELKHFFEIRLSPVEIITKFNKPVFKYLDVPAEPVDLLYLDGPHTLPDVKITLNPIELEQYFQPGFIGLVDGRGDSVEYYKQNFMKKYKFKKNWALGNTIFELIR